MWVRTYVNVTVSVCTFVCVPVCVCVCVTSVHFPKLNVPQTLVDVNARPPICCFLIVPLSVKKENGGILSCRAGGGHLFPFTPPLSPGHSAIVCEISCSSGSGVCTECTSRSVYFMPKGGEAAAAEENKPKRGRLVGGVMNGTVGKLAGDGP